MLPHNLKRIQLEAHSSPTTKTIGHPYRIPILMACVARCNRDASSCSSNSILNYVARDKRGKNVATNMLVKVSLVLAAFFSVAAYTSPRREVAF